MPAQIALVVQWIEQVRPKDKMGVRFPPGAPVSPKAGRKWHQGMGAEAKSASPVSRQADAGIDSLRKHLSCAHSVDEIGFAS